MSKSLLDLAHRLEKEAGELKEKASRLSVQVAEAIVSDLAYVTPVDTSKALSNWQVSLDKPIPQSGEIEAHFPGVFGWTHGPSASATIAAAKKVLQEKRPGVTIWISNVVDYIVPLNNGSSKQEPAGFVERAVLIGRSLLRKK